MLVILSNPSGCANLTGSVKGVVKVSPLVRQFSKSARMLAYLLAEASDFASGRLQREVLLDRLCYSMY